MDKVSIIIPVYNAERYMEKCLDSVCGQTYGNLEIILVNDGSTDGSLSICRRYCDADSRIQLISKDNEGVSIARNVGRDTASGDYCLFIDADDSLAPDMVEKLLLLAHTTKAEVAICQIQICHEGEELESESGSGEYAVYDRQEALRMYVRGGKLKIGAWNKLIHMDIARQVDFEPNRRSNEDKYYCFEVLRRAETVAYIDEKLYHYWSHGDSASRKQFDDRWFDNRYFARKIYQIVCDEYPKLEKEGRYQLFLTDYHLLRTICKAGMEKNYSEQLDEIRCELIHIPIGDIRDMIKNSSVMMVAVIRVCMPLFVWMMHRQGKKRENI